jgi:CelD/BcsL family acetyltransferase involved in cellulose biosynthesis
MFEYVRNEYNPHPVLLLEPDGRPPDRLVRDLPYARALSFPIPGSEAELEARHGRKWWATVRRKERRLCERSAGVRFRVLTSRDDLTEMLPQVQRLFVERWTEEYTSFAWKTPDGFAPYADAMLDLAAQGRAELAVLEGDGRLLSFAYCLVDGDVYRFYQHATIPDARYRPFSVGKILVTRLVEDLVRRPRVAEFDFMTGESEYKREWGTVSRPIVHRIDEPRTARGALRFAVRLSLVTAKHRVQFGPPRVRATAKAVLLTLDRASSKVSRRS